MGCSCARAVETFLKNESGFTVTIGKEPYLDNYAKIFDWTILESVGEFYKKFRKKPNSSLGTFVVAFGLQNWQKNIPKERLTLWTYLVENNLVEVIQIKNNLSFGGKLRELQSSSADLLITLGGARGVHHLVDLFSQSAKPVIPLNIPISNVETASEYHFKRFCENPEKYIEIESTFNILATFSLLNFNNKPIISCFKNNLIKIIDHILPSRVFFIRLMNPIHDDYQEVETYFRKIVDPVIQKMEFRRFEAGLDPSKEPFMNLEIFNNLHFSSLAFVDVTGLRNNCFLELGYSLGQQKKYILSAKHDTCLPFDTKMINCHFWNLANGIEEEKVRLENFIKQHINKNPLISK